MNRLQYLSRATGGRMERSLLAGAGAPFSRIRCRFLSSPSSASSPTTVVPAATAASEPEGVSAASSATATSLQQANGDNYNNNSLLLEQSGLLDVCRHGRGDAVILLNVGGQEFSTLRSTVATNPVLAEYVARAEANQEFMGSKGGGSKSSAAVFVDRDPTYFPLILNHLRNKVEGLSYYSNLSNSSSSSSSSTASSLAKKKLHLAKPTTYHVQLPKDIRALRDIYVEASHYRIPELEKASCKENFMVSLVGIFGGSSNPFDQANQLFQMVRRGLVAAGSIGTVAFTAQQDINLTKIGAVLFPAWISESSAGKTDKSKSENEQEPAVA